MKSQTRTGFLLIAVILLLPEAKPSSFAAEKEKKSGASTKTQAESHKVAERIRVLIEGLNDDSFQIREASEKELSRMGKSALKPVQDATQSSSAEVRFRAERILKKIQKNIRLESVVSVQPSLKELSVVVLDNCDPNFQGDGPHFDGLRLLTEKGKERFISRQFNNCEAIGINHGVALDPKRARIYIREFVTNRVTAFDPNGTIVFQMDEVPNPYALAVDPHTGNVWCLSNKNRNNKGEIIVLSPQGKRISSIEVEGFDITFSPHDQTFWIVGNEVIKMSRNGQILFRGAGVEWRYVAVASDPKDGSVWVVERKHSQRKGNNRLVRFDAKGKIVRSIDLGNSMPMDVACDPESSTAWVVDFRNQLIRVPVKGEPLAPLKIPARSVAIGNKSGHIWVATDESVLRIDRDGKTLAEYPLKRSSSQTWLAAY